MLSEKIGPMLPPAHQEASLDMRTLRPIADTLGKTPNSLLGVVLLLGIEVEGEELTVPFEIVSWDSYTCKYKARPTRELDMRRFGEISFEDVLTGHMNLSSYEAIYVDDGEDLEEQQVDLLVEGSLSGPVTNEKGNVLHEMYLPVDCDRPADQDDEGGLDIAGEGGRGGL